MLARMLLLYPGEDYLPVLPLAHGRCYAPQWQCCDPWVSAACCTCARARARGGWAGGHFRGESSKVGSTEIVQDSQQKEEWLP